MSQRLDAPSGNRGLPPGLNDTLCANRAAAQPSWRRQWRWGGDDGAKLGVPRTRETARRAGMVARSHFLLSRFEFGYKS